MKDLQNSAKIFLLCL